jgi:hypothetical protein
VLLVRGRAWSSFPLRGPLRVGALVWRVDADGLAFLFARGIQHRFIRAA